MIARHEANAEQRDLWARLSANVPPEIVQWRQQGKPIARGGQFVARFVAYIDAQFVRNRLDMVVPGEWDLTLEMLPSLAADGDGVANDEPVAFKARLQILGVIREDVGTGRDYKNASTDAFKRAAVRFGIGHELYTDYEIIWVAVDGDGKYAKALEDPAQVFARKHGSGVKSASVESASSPAVAPQARTAPEARQQPAPEPSATSVHTGDEAACPKCGGPMFDNRVSKRNPKAPDYKCKQRSCDGVIWPPRNAAPARATADEYEEPTDDYDRSLPF